MSTKPNESFRLFFEEKPRYVAVVVIAEVLLTQLTGITGEKKGVKFATVVFLSRTLIIFLLFPQVTGNIPCQLSCKYLLQEFLSTFMFPLFSSYSLHNIKIAQLFNRAKLLLIFNNK